jgi:hypothetical protein
MIRLFIFVFFLCYCSVFAVELSKDKPFVAENGIELRLIGNRASVTVKTIGLISVRDFISPPWAVSSSGDGFLIIGIPALDTNVQFVESNPSQNWYVRETKHFAARAYVTIAVGDTTWLQLLKAPRVTQNHLNTFCSDFGYGISIPTAPWSTTSPKARALLVQQMTQVLFRYRALGFSAPRLRRSALPITTALCGAYELNFGLENNGDGFYATTLGAYNVTKQSILVDESLPFNDLLETFTHELFHAIHFGHIGKQGFDLWVTEGLATLAQRSMLNIGGTIERSLTYKPRLLDVGLPDDAEEFEYETQDFFADVLSRQIQGTRGSFKIVAEMIPSVRNASTLNAFLKSKGTSLIEAYENYALHKIKKAHLLDAVDTLFRYTKYTCSDAPLKLGFEMNNTGILASRLVFCGDLSKYKIEASTNVRFVYLDKNLEKTEDLTTTKAVLFYSLVNAGKFGESFSIIK